jgi:hypothetical protein
MGNSSLDDRPSHIDIRKEIAKIVPNKLSNFVAFSENDIQWSFYPTDIPIGSSATTKFGGVAHTPLL